MSLRSSVSVSDVVIFVSMRLSVCVTEVVCLCQ